MDFSSLYDEIKKASQKNAYFYEGLKRRLDKGVLLGQGIDIVKFYRDGYKQQKEQPIYISEETRFQHFGCIGSTGCGKTSLMRGQVIQDILRGDNILIFDPKKDEELLSQVIEAAAYADRLDSFFFFSPIYPDLSIKINLLKQYQIPEELINHIISGVKAKDEYYINVAQEVSIAIVLGLILLAKASGKEPTLNFYEIKKWGSYSGIEKLYQSLKYLTSHSDPAIGQEAKDILLVCEHILKSPQDFFSKVSSSLRTILTVMSTSSTGKIIGKAVENDFIDRLDQGKSVILYCYTGSLLIRRTAKLLSKILVSMVQSCMGRLLAKGKKFNPPLSVYIDEGHNVLYPEIEELFGMGRAGGVKLHFYSQSFADLDKEIGPERAKVIIDNINTWVFMKVKHLETARYIEGLFPTVRKKYLIHNFQMGIYEPLIRESDEKAITVEYITNLEKRYFTTNLKGNYYCAEALYIPSPKIQITLPEEKKEVPTDVERMLLEEELMGEEDQETVKEPEEEVIID